MSQLLLLFTEVKLWSNIASLPVPATLLLLVLCSAPALKQAATSDSIKCCSSLGRGEGNRPGTVCVPLFPGGKIVLSQSYIITLTVSDLDREKLDKKSSLVSRNLRSVFCFRPPAKQAGCHQTGFHMHSRGSAMGSRPSVQDRVMQQKLSSNPRP